MEVDPTDTIGQAHKAHEAEVERNRKRAAYREAFREVMAARSGRRVVWDLLSQAGVFHSSFGATDAQTNFNEGRRSLGLRLLADVNEFCPELYARMQAETKGG